jgi:hypothetical protein
MNTNREAEAARAEPDGSTVSRRKSGSIRPKNLTGIVLGVFGGTNPNKRRQEAK